MFSESTEYWISSFEEILTLDKEILDIKHEEFTLNENSNIINESDEDKNISAKPSDGIYRLMGIADIEQKEFYKNALKEWKDELNRICSTQRKNSSAYEGVEKRHYVLKKLYNMNLLQKLKKKVQKKKVDTSDQVDNVPVIVRLGILSLFPIIESLSGLESSRYQTLCSRIFDSLISVLSNLPALSMKNEPPECIDAFQDFISNLIKENDFKIDSDLSQKALNALITIAVSRGNLSSFLYVIDTLFNIYSNLSLEGRKSVKLSVGNLISKLSNLKCSSIDATFNERYDIPFKIEELNRILTRSGKNYLNNGTMAVDGKYLYLLNGCGLFKVGSGLHNTVKGYIYDRNDTIKTTRHPLTISCWNDKLYILTNLSEGENDNYEVIVLDTSLKELKRIKLKPHPGCKKMFLISDGIKFYLIGIKTNVSNISTPSNTSNVRTRIVDRSSQISQSNSDISESSESSTNSDDDEREWEEEYEEEEYQQEEYGQYSFMQQLNVLRTNVSNLGRKEGYIKESASKFGEIIHVDIYEEDSFENPVKSFEISFQTGPGVNEVFYCTGQHLVYFKRSFNSNATFNVYNLENNQKSDINKISITNPFACYDPMNNLIWTFSDEESIVTPYIHHGSTPLQDPIESQFKPENVINELEISETSAMNVEEILLSMSAHMNRFSRNHPLYHVTFIPYDDASHTSVDFLDSPMNIDTFKFISRALFKALELLSANDGNNNFAFVVNTILKLLKICAYELSAKEIDDPKSINELKSKLVEFINSESDDEHSNIVKHSAIDVLIVGFNVLFPSRSDKLSFILDCIKNASKSKVHYRMMNSLLYSLSRWYGIGSLLVSEEDIKAQDESSKKTKRKEKKQIKNMTDDLKTILTSLIRLSNKETLESMGAVKEGKSVNLHINPSLKLILAIQKEFMYSATAKPYIIDYIGILVPEVTSFIDEIQKSFTLNNKHPEYDDVLRSSILNIVLLPLVSYFVKRSYSKNFDFAINIIEHMITLITTLDKFNESLGLIREVNILCFYKQPNKIAKSYEWLIELENIIALVCGNISAALIEGEQPSDKENQCKSWLDTRLLNGGLDKASPETSDRLKFLYDFAEGSEDTKPLYTWLTKVSGNRLMLRATAKKFIESAERHIYAAMFKHLGLIDEARSILSSLTSEPVSIISAEAKGKFSFLGQKVSSLSSYLIRKGEIQKEWQIAIEDKPEDSSVFDSFQQDIHKLKELCEMKDVEFDLVEPNESVKNLFNKLQEEINDYEKKRESDENFQLPNPYEYVCDPVIQRAKFLLKMMPSNRTIHPSADRANPFSISKPFSRRSLRASTSRITTDTNVHPLSKSISQLPATETAQAKERRRVHEEQTSRDFSQRVSALRKWIRSYNSWKNWQDSTLLEKSNQMDESPPNSPLQGVISFVQNSFITIKDLDKIIKVQNSRAKCRIEGLNYLKKLLSVCTSTTARNQMLGSMSKIFSKGTHYLDSIQSSGEALTIEVTKSFVSLCEFITSIFKDTSIDPTSRILALSICNITYREQDIDILSKPSLLAILRKVMNESLPKLKSSVESDEDKKKEYNEFVMKQHEILKQASWTALRILIIQSIGWSLDEDIIQDKSAVTEVLQDIYDLIFEEISRITMNLSTYSFKKQKDIDIISNEQSFQLLSLLYLLTNNFRKPIVSKNLNILQSVLRTSTSTKSQRLIIRLLRKILFTQYEFVNEDIVNSFLNQIGKWIIDGRYMIQDKVSDSSKDKRDEKSESKKDTKSELYEVHILTLPNSAKRSLEEILSESSGNNNENLDNLVHTQKVIKEISDSGFSQLKKGDKETCESFAKNIAELGCSVRIQKLSSEDDDKTTPQNNDIRQFPHWINGHAALCLASEYISLLRSFTLPNCNHQFDILKSSLKKHILKIPKIVETLKSEKELSKEFLRNDLNKAIASLCVLSGFHEPIRVGGKVIIKSGIVDEEATSATVIRISPSNKVEVILDSATKEVRKLDIRYVKPTPEILIDPVKFSSFTNEVLPSLLSVLNEKEGLPRFNQILFNDLQLRSLHVISILLQHPECLQFALKSSLKKYILPLFEKLKQCKPTSHFSNLRSSIVELAQYLYNLHTRPSSIYSSSSRMSDILPYCPFNNAKSLPYALVKGKVLSVIFHGDEMRTVEYIGAKPVRRSERQRGRPNQLTKPTRGSNTPLEVVIFGNNVIPSLNTDYYFEIKVDKAEPESIISIGLSKEGAHTWEPGSHRYQANKFKTFYPDNMRKIENYGETFSEGSVVGCGWNQAEGMIYFTKDGVDLGPAFTNVYKNNERVVPAIGIGKGVKVTVNFGQSPFTFDLSILNDKELKEKRRLETEERLRREEEERQAIIKAAAEPILQMGYDMKKVLKALEATGYDDPEATVMWLLENADSIPDEPEEEIKEEQKPEETQPESSVQEESKEEKDSYDITASSNYVLKDIYTYYSSLDRNRKVKDTESVKELLIQEWETKAMPNLKDWMEKDGFKPYEITEYLHRITEEYKKGNEKGARDIVAKLLGGTSPPVQLPSVKSFLDTSIKIYQIQVGMHLIVKTKTSHQMDWISPQMDNTIGKVGVVKKIDAKANRVLMEFYDPERSTIEEWWYSTQSLAKTSKPIKTLDYSAEKVTESYRFISTQLGNIYSRRIVLLFLEHTKLSDLPEIDISITDSLEIAASEYLSSSKMFTSSKSLLSDKRSSNRMNLIAQKLLDHLEELKPDPEIYNKFVDDLIQKACNYIEESIEFCKPEIISNGTWIPSVTRDFEYDNARAVSIIFDKSTAIPRKGKIEIIADDENSEPLITYLPNEPLVPYVVSTNNLFIRFSSEQKTVNRAILQLLPINSEFSLARWLSDFISEYTLKSKPNIDILFNTILNFIYSSSSPNSLKEALFNNISRLLLNIIQLGINDKNIITTESISRLKTLKSEMIHLYTTESSKLKSSYLQSLSEMFSIVKYYKDFVFDYDDQDPSIPDVNIIDLMIEYQSNAPQDSDEKEEQKGEEESLSTLSEEKLSNVKSLLNYTKPRLDEDEPEWLSDIYNDFKILEFFCSRDNSNKYQNYILTDLLKSVWVNFNNNYDTIRKRLVMLNGLPSLPVNQKVEIVSSVEEMLNDFSIQILETSTWLPIDRENNVTKTYMIIELRNESKVNELIENLKKKPFKLNDDDNESYNLTATSIESIDPFRSLTKICPPPSTESTDTRLIEYLRDLLIDPETKNITKSYERVLTEIFTSFSVDYSVNGVIDKERLLEFQKICSYESIDENTINEIFSDNETKEYEYTLVNPPFPGTNTEPSQSKSGSGSTIKTSGITLNGFINIYKNQAIDFPVETWEELFNLGYDLHLTKVQFYNIKDAVISILNNPLFNNISCDEELVRYVEQCFNETDLNSQLDMSSSDISPIHTDAHISLQYPKLAKLSLPTLRLRFELIKLFNSKLLTLLPLVNLKGDGILSRRLSQCRGIIFHSVKMQFFYDVLDKTSVQIEQPTVTIDRLQLAAKNEKLGDNIDNSSSEEFYLKNTAFGIAFDQLRHIDPLSLRQKKPVGAEPHFSIKIDFKGENVEGEGGPYRQFFTDVSRELTKVLPLLIPCPNAQTKVGKNRDKYIVAPSCKSSLYLRMYKFLGNLMGIAIRTGVILSVDFPSFFWKPLTGQELTLEDLKDIDHSFYGFMKYMEICKRSDLEGESRFIFEKFKVTLSDKSTVLLKPDGDNIDVTYNNREEYISLAIKARLNEHFIQMKHILQGLTEIIPEPLLKLCTWQDLEWRVCGKPYIDINLLKRHTQYAAVSSQAPHIKYFWQVLRSFSQEDRRAFIRFAWAQERLPTDDQEFIRTQTRMLIKPFEGLVDPDSSFPKADTCFFNLMLPQYSSPQILREKLLFAIHTDADSMDADEPNQNDEDEIGNFNYF